MNLGSIGECGFAVTSDQNSETASLEWGLKDSGVAMSFCKVTTFSLCRYYRWRIMGIARNMFWDFIAINFDVTRYLIVNEPV